MKRICPGTRKICPQMKRICYSMMKKDEKEENEPLLNRQVGGIC
jgi:hypothetical protein